MNGDSEEEKENVAEEDSILEDVKFKTSVDGDAIGNLCESKKTID